MKCGCITHSFNIDWLFQKRVVRTKLDIYVYISITVSIPLLGGLLVPRGIVRPVVSVSTLTRFI